MVTLALSYGIVLLAYAGCLVPLVLFRRGVKRAGVAPYGVSIRFLLKGVAFVVLADAVVLVLAIASGLDDAIAMPMRALATLLVVTLVYRGTRWQLRAAGGRAES